MTLLNEVAPHLADVAFVESLEAIDSVAFGVQPTFNAETHHNTNEAHRNGNVLVLVRPSPQSRLVSPQR